MNYDLEDMTVEELRALAEQHGLSRSGRKEDLIQRLQQDGVSSQDEQGQGGTIPGDGGLDAASVDAGGAVTAVQPPQDTEGVQQAGDQSEEDAPQGDVEPPQSPFPSAGQSGGGLPVQMDPERQDESVKGIRTNERGLVLESPDRE